MSQTTGPAGPEHPPPETKACFTSLVLYGNPFTLVSAVVSVCSVGRRPLGREKDRKKKRELGNSASPHF